MPTAAASSVPVIVITPSLVTVLEPVLSVALMAVPPLARELVAPAEFVILARWALMPFPPFVEVTVPLFVIVLTIASEAIPELIKAFIPSPEPETTMEPLFSKEEPYSVVAIPFIPSPVPVMLICPVVSLTRVPLTAAMAAPLMEAELEA